MKLKSTYVSEKTTILAVDDNPVALKLMESMLEITGYTILTAKNGKEAMAVLKANAEEIDIILLDRMMPEMDGLEFCKRIKADAELRSIPVIMQTAAGRPQDIREGIEAGVFYYLVKPLIAETLLSIVTSAKRQVRKYKQHKNELLQRKESIGMVQSMTCTYKTIEEAEVLAAFLAQFFPQPDLVITGITELFFNAVEHGNLEIDYQQKGELIKKNLWKEEVQRRLAAPLYRDKKVITIFKKSEAGCSIMIRDEGEGFNWQDYLQVDTVRATQNHGRGIVMAKMLSFDQLVYNEKGNEVTGIVKN